MKSRKGMFGGKRSRRVGRIVTPVVSSGKVKMTGRKGKKA